MRPTPTDLRAEYRDLAPADEVAIHLASRKGYGGALAKDEVRFVWDQLRAQLKGKRVGALDLGRLAGIEVVFEPGPGIETRAGTGRIVIADGHIRAVSLFAHALAKLEAIQQLTNCYAQWFRFFIDAIVAGDPVIPFGRGYSDTLRTLNTPNIQRSPQVGNFRDIVIGFTAFLLAHEAAHILHDHASLLSAASCSKRSDDVLALSRALELEADKTAIDLLMAADWFIVGGFSAWQQWLTVRTVAVAALAGADYRVGTTHPAPVERFRAALSHVATHKQIDAAQVGNLVAYFEQVIQRYETELLRGDHSLFSLRNRPAKISPREQRVMQRIMVLDICTARAIAPKVPGAQL
jgi:hypothetical protein